VYHQDFAEYPGYYNGVGQAQAPVRAIAFGDMDGVQVYRGGEILSKMLEGDEVLLVLSKQDAAYAERAPRAGLLVVADDPQALTRRITPSGRSAVFLNPITGKVTGRATPTLWISEELANRLLATSGETVAGLRQQAQDLPREGVLDLATGAGVSMVVTGTLEDKWPASNVIGHWPGVSGRAGSGEATFDRTMPGSAVQDARGGDAQLDDELVVVLARYDSPPVGPEGVWPMANDNASGVAVMLETIRAMKESGYEPYRTFLFVAYSGEGLDGGEPIEPKDVSKFIQAKAGFATAFDVEAIVNLQGLGAGQGDGLVLAASGNQRLASLFESAARRSGVSTRRAETPVDLSIVFEDRSMQEGGGQEAPYILLTWDGWEGTARTAADTPDRIRADKLEQAARTLALALMTIGREDRY
jgi:hypothetical protein